MRWMLRLRRVMTRREDHLGGLQGDREFGEQVLVGFVHFTEEEICKETFITLYHVSPTTLHSIRQFFIL